MHVFARTSWFLLACVGVAVAVDAASKNSGIVELDLVFPRNDTYAPTPSMPIIFAFQNPELASFLIPGLFFTVWNRNKNSENVITTSYDLTWRNFSSSDPFFVYHGFSNFNTEGSWWLTWHLGRVSCKEDSLNSPYGDDRFVINNTGASILFTTKNSAQEVDLVAATNKDCAEAIGFAVNVTNTLKVPGNVRWDGGEMCAVVESHTPIPNPCGAKIDSAAASSISSSLTASRCRGTNPPVSCPPKDEDREGTAQQLAVGAVACFAAALGALGFIVV